MGYLFCGPVGTGKIFMVECLVGEAAVPVVKMKNFRDKWVGSTESNLEKIFRLLDALGRRNADSGDSGVSGRVYGTMAERMSDYQSPVPLAVIHEQIALAVAEATDLGFGPERFRK